MYMKTSEYQQLKVLQHKKNVSIIHAKKNDLHVIIKRFHTSILQPNDRQWEKEIEIMRTINHPSVPRLLHTYDDFIDNKRLPHLIIEYIHGESLKEILKNVQTVTAGLSKNEGQLLKQLKLLHRVLKIF